MTYGVLSSETYEAVAYILGEDAAEEVANLSFAEMTQEGAGGPQDAAEKLDTEDKDYMDLILELTGELEETSNEYDIVYAAHQTGNPQAAVEYAMANAPDYQEVVSGEITLTG